MVLFSTRSLYSLLMFILTCGLACSPLCQLLFCCGFCALFYCFLLTGESSPGGIRFAQFCWSYAYWQRNVCFERLDLCHAAQGVKNNYKTKFWVSFVNKLNRNLSQGCSLLRFVLHSQFGSRQADTPSHTTNQTTEKCHTPTSSRITGFTLSHEPGIQTL